MCSTPFGINGRETSNLAKPLRIFIVLNAFRHQRKGNAGGEKNGTRNYSCAQRLSASTEGKRDWRRAHHASAGLVLNAFRHQRKGNSESDPQAAPRTPCSTPFGINGRETLFLLAAQACGQAVLNAFRHQRKGNKL